jgi:hypothetical protein
METITKMLMNKNLGIEYHFYDTDIPIYNIDPVGIVPIFKEIQKCQRV